MRSVLGVLLVAASMALRATAALSQVHVPGDYATIQAAINSGAPIVYVADGLWNEALSISHTVTLLPEPPADPRQPTPFPRVTGMNITQNPFDDPTVTVRGFHFTGTISQTNAYARNGVTTIEGCKLDNGFTTFGLSGLSETIKIRSCVITGDVFVYAYNTEFTGNMVWKGQVDVHSNGGTGARIRDNLVIGPSNNGLMSTSGDAAGSMTNNTVMGVKTGYSIVYGTVSGNTATDCGTGYVNAGMGGTRTFIGNTARRCGVGIDLAAATGNNAISYNTIDSSATYGIHSAAGVVTTCTWNAVKHSGSDGIRLEGYGRPTSNLVLLSGGAGIRSVDRAEGNTVGRSGSHGIVARSARQNTVYWNGGAGIYANGAAPDTIDHNISYGNAAYGLTWAGTGTPMLSCNDWYNNALGSTSPVAPGASDLAADPLFCNLPADNAYLSTSSPCANPIGCGRIGSQAVACGTPAEAPHTGDAEVRFSVRPNPTPGEVAMRWARSRERSRIEVFDLTGALRFRTELPGEVTDFVWRGEDEAGSALRGGVYFVRRTAGDVVEHARVVITP